MSKRLAALLAGLTALVFGSALVAAQSDEPTVHGTRFENYWPNSVSVSGLVDGGEVAAATFLYSILPEGALTRTAAVLGEGDVVRVTAEFPTRNPTLWIPAGADFEWRWELVGADGRVWETEPQVWRYEDPRFEWRSLRSGVLEVAYYDSQAVAQQMLDEGAAALAQMAPFLGLAELIPMKVYVWANSEDAREVERVQSEEFEEAVITGGTRVLADLVHIYTPSRWVVRHELTHVLTKLAGEGPYGDLPAWLDEGMATLSEGDWFSRRGGALNFAISTDTVLSLRSMESPSNIPGQVDIFYGQSAAIVDYLLQEYGNAKMHELFAIFKEGSSAEAALVAVYGLTRNELDNEWRAAVGLGPREEGEDRSTTIEDEVISGPQVAEGEQEAEPAQEAQQEEEELELMEEENPEGSEEAAAAAEEEVEEEEEQIMQAGRSEEETAARTAEIERRQEERRAGPQFAAPEAFPWEYPLIGIAAALVLLSGLLLGRVLAGRR